MANKCNKTQAGKPNGANTTSKKQLETDSNRPANVGPPSPPESPKSETNPPMALSVPSERQGTAAVVSNVFDSMQNTIGRISKAMEALGEQSARLTVLGHAVDAAFQLRTVTDEVVQRLHHNEQQMAGLKVRLQEQVKVHIRETVRPLVSALISRLVKKETADRVHREIARRTPASIQEKLLEYKVQIRDIRTRLQISEARRHNALIRSASLNEPLQPLLRPVILQSFNMGAGSNVGDGGQAGEPLLSPPTSASTVSRTTRPGATGHRLSVDTGVRTSAAMTAPQSTVAPLMVGRRVWDVEVPSPSPLFPPDMTALVSLGEDEVRVLLRDYGLGDELADDSMAMHGGGSPLGTRAAYRGGASGGQRPLTTFTGSDSRESWIAMGLQSSREENLNRFMKHIGVGFQLLPSSPVVLLGGRGGTAEAASGSMRSPLVERPEFAWVR